MVNYLDYIVGYFCLDEWYVLWILFSFLYRIWSGYGFFVSVY